MLSKLQKDYLDAMGISVWSLRDPPAVAECSEPAPPAEDIELAAEAPVEVVAVATPAPAPRAVTDAQPEAPGLKLGPGRGGILLVCEKDSDSASRLANDISRALGSVPVWAWPDDGAGAARLDAAVQENLFTTIAIFGEALVQRFYPHGAPANVHAANLVQLPAMQDIGARADARRTLWTALCRAGMVSRN